MPLRPAYEVGGGWTGSVSDVAGVCLGQLSTADLTKVLGQEEAGMSVAGDIVQGPAVHRCLSDSREKLLPSPRIHLLPYRQYQDRIISLGGHFLHEKD